MSLTAKKNYSKCIKSRTKSLHHAKLRRNRTILWIFLIICAASIAVTSLLYGFILGGHVVVMRINGIPVTRDEFLFYMKKERTAVTNYFYQTYGVKANEQVWTKKYGTERPIDVLKEKAKQACIYDKVIQGLAAEHGIIKDISYRGFLSRLKMLNKEREEKASKGETLYGIVKFTQLQYYLQEMSTLKAELQEKLENKHIFVSEEEIRERYNERYDIYNNDSNIKIAEIHIPFVLDYMAEDVKTNGNIRSLEEASSLIYEIKKQLDEGADFDELCKTYTGEEPLEMVIPLDDSSNDPSSTKAILVRNAFGLKKGEHSEPFENGFGFSIIKLIDDKAWRSVPYSEAYTSIYNTILSEKYEDYLIKQVQLAEVKVHKLIFDLIRFK